MPKWTRRKLLAGAAPLALAPLAATRLGHEHTAAAGERLATHEGHEHIRMGHAAMIGAGAPAVGGPNDLDTLLYPPAALPHQPGRVREYRLVAKDVEIEVAPGVFFPAWTYNGTVPGPVIRATEGDVLRVNFLNAGSHP